MEIDGLPERTAARLREAAVALFRRYVSEFVEPFGICPWAQPTRAAGRLREQVVLSRAPSLDEVARAIARLGDDAEVEIGIVLFPRLDLDRLAFARFVASVRDALPPQTPFALADFHPDAAADAATSGSLVSFVRRTPDPTIQLVRRSVLDALRREAGHGSGFVDPSKIDWAALLAAQPKAPLHERIEERNRDTIAREGLARLAALLDELRAERDALYREILGSELRAQEPSS